MPVLHTVRIDSFRKNARKKTLAKLPVPQIFQIASLPVRIRDDRSKPPVRPERFLGMNFAAFFRAPEAAERSERG
jgi:hypothetical protein